MKLPKIKVDCTTSSRPGLGVTFPMTNYVDGIITLLFLDINFKWRKK